MGRMENSELNETQPGRATPQQPEPENPGLEATQPVLESPELGATIPVQAQPTVDSEASLAETVAIPVNHNEADQPGFEATIPPPADFGQAAPRTSQGPSLKLIGVLGVLALALIAAVSAIGGYRNGIHMRTKAEATQVYTLVQEQYELGVQNLANKEYDLAQQRLEYVVQHNPNYPGLTDKLAEVIMQLNITATPIPQAQPSTTPTPDMRGVQDMLAQAQTALQNKDWDTVVNTALSIRKSDINFQPVQVDDLLYEALRNRGRDRILNGDLEGGIYDLTLAERFGPLDAEAKGLLNWSRLYITGASFWELDWGQAVYYFGQVAPALPNLRDGSGLTATERYRTALIGYGGYLGDHKQYCDAMKQYEIAISMGTNDQKVQDAYNFATQKCTGNQPGQENATETPVP